MTAQRPPLPRPARYSPAVYRPSPAPTPAPKPMPKAVTVFLTPSEVAAKLRVSKMTVYRLIHGGEITAVRIGRSFRMTEQAVNRYLSEATTDADTDR